MAKKKVFQISDALTEGLEQTISAAHNYSGELRVEVIPLKKIEVDPENPRDLVITFADVRNGLRESDDHFIQKSKELESLQSIAHSIREQGIINPIVVYKHGENYRLVAGERRSLASVLAGKTDIQAKILESKPSDFRISLLQWIENIERTDLSLWERLRNLEKIVMTYAVKKGISAERVTVTELSNLIGCTKPHAMNYKAVLLADDHLKNLIRENRIKNLEKAALLAGIQSSDVKHHAVEACLSGATLKKLKVIIEQSDKKIISLARVRGMNKRGRQSTAVNFGSTKNIQVAQIILNSILNNNVLTHLSSHFTDVNWSDHKSITDTFKVLVKKLEEIQV